MNECKFCGRVINNKGSLVAHENCCKLNPNRVSIPRGRIKGSEPWNKGLSLTDAVSKGIISEDVRQRILSGSKKGGKKMGGSLNDPILEIERRKKISSTMKKNPMAGGKRHGSGRGKKGWYKGIFCDSSWELAYVIYSLDNGIDIKRNTESFSYYYKGQDRTYIPDFIVDGKIVEIKGYKSKQWEAKISQCEAKISVLYEEEMKPYIDFVVDKYGKNFIDMYE